METSVLFGQKKFIVFQLVDAELEGAVDCGVEPVVTDSLQRHHSGLWLSLYSRLCHVMLARGVQTKYHSRDLELNILFTTNIQTFLFQ